MADWKLKIVRDKRTGEEHILTGYQGYSHAHDIIKEIEPFQFYGTLRYISMGRGQSAVMYRFNHSCGMPLQVGSKGMGDILKCLQGEGTVSETAHGFEGDWEFRKNGNSVYVYPVIGLDSQ